jgi:hypothetical protein
MRIKKDSHRQYLERTARELSRRTGRHVAPQEVLEALLNMAIRDEAIYDPEDSRPISETRRTVAQAERGARASAFLPHELMLELQESSGE